MLRPRTHAPTLAKPRAAKPSSTPVSLPPAPCTGWKVRVGKTRCVDAATDGQRVVEAFPRTGAEAVNGYSETGPLDLGLGLDQAAPPSPFGLTRWLVKLAPLPGLTTTHQR